MDGRIMYGAPMKTASFSAADMKRLDEVAADRLRVKGYLVLAPGDTSPLGELVRAAQLVDPGAHLDALSDDQADRVFDALAAVQRDPAIRAWASKEQEK